MLRLILIWAWLVTVTTSAMLSMLCMPWHHLYSHPEQYWPKPAMAGNGLSAYLCFLNAPTYANLNFILVILLVIMFSSSFQLLMFDKYRVIHISITISYSCLSDSWTNPRHSEVCYNVANSYFELLLGWYCQGVIHLAGAYEMIDSNLMELHPWYNYTIPEKKLSSLSCIFSVSNLSSSQPELSAVKLPYITKIEFIVLPLIFPNI